MAKWIGNQDVEPDKFPKSPLPSNSVIRDSPPTTNSYPTSRATHVHHSPKGENDQAGQRPYQAPGNKQLKCSGREQEPFTKPKTSYLQDTATGGHYSRHDGEDLYSGKPTRSMRYADTDHDPGWDSRTGKSTSGGFNGERLGKMGKSG